jgi:hypothetical protein
MDDYSRDIGQLNFSLASLLQKERSIGVQEKRLALNMAFLTAPLGRPLKASEVVVTVADLREFPDRRTEVEDDFDYLNEIIPLTTGEKLYNLPGAYYSFDRSYVTFEGYVSDGQKLIVTDAQYTDPNWEKGFGHEWFFENLPFHAYSPIDRTCVLNLPSQNSEDDVFLFNHKNSRVNFGHLIHDLLLQVRIYHAVAKVNPSVKVILPMPFKYEMQNEILYRIFQKEFDDGRVISSEGAGQYRKVYMAAPQFPPIEPAIGFAGARFIRKLLMGLAGNLEAKLSEKPARKIFVSRVDGTSNAYNRDQIDNEKLQDLFVQNGFVPLVISQLKPHEIIEKFSTAEVVAGLHGAGLLNIVFSSAERPLLIELDALVPTWRSIERFVRGVGMRHELCLPTVSNNSIIYERLESILKSC